MQKELPKHLKPRDKNPANKKDFEYIPKKIFQTWETNQVSPEMYEVVNTWVDKNPDWEYHFFDKNDRRNFIKDNFPKKVLDAYDILIPGAYKADLWRYCVLYIHGGVYADIKLVLCNSLNNLLDFNTRFTSVKEKNGLKVISGGVLNNFICVMPKHPFLKKAIDLVVKHVTTGYFGRRSIAPTGPLALGTAINLVLGRPERQKFVVGKHKIGNFEFTLWYCPGKSIFLKSGFTCISINRKSQVKCFIVGYESYWEERNSYAKRLGEHEYGYCWENCMIYKNGDLDREHILYPGISQIKKSYKNKNYSNARKLILERFLKYKQFKFVILRCLIQYELMSPFFRLFRLFKIFK